MQLGEHRLFHSEISRSLGWLADLREARKEALLPLTAPEPGVRSSGLWQPQVAFPGPLFYHISYWSQEQLLAEKSKDKFRQLKNIPVHG